ncbi:hypothetical protein NPIL_17521 [Nephila pilipes]|uniref:Uncharacterized protein n=1 Tax=Nephila pilipes TaxID=299642 RepID=A0A8X6NLN7_NEPPI|nr:hypothetical protein NPIL_17521 [Nephila pilipes]
MQQSITFHQTYKTTPVSYAPSSSLLPDVVIEAVLSFYLKLISKFHLSLCLLEVPVLSDLSLISPASSASSSLPSSSHCHLNMCKVTSAFKECVLHFTSIFYYGPFSLPIAAKVLKWCFTLAFPTFSILNAQACCLEFL